MSVNSYLTDLASKLVLSEDEKSSIGVSIVTLQDRLDTWFGSLVKEHFQFGSSTRGTILPRKADENSDIDYMVVFDTSSGQKKPQTYLNDLRKFAEEKYSSSEIHQSSPTMVLSLNHIKFELVPAIYNWGYEIPSPSTSWSDWMTTDPLSFKEKLAEKNKSENSMIKPLIRLVKYWNSRNSHLFPSFDLEKGIVEMLFIYCSSQKDYFYYFWDRFSCPYNSSQNTKSRVESAKKHIELAKEYEAQGLIYPAESEIKKVLPEL